MATISSTIMLQDRFSSVLHSVINAVNSSVTAMDNLAQSMSANIDMSSFEVARNAISSATDALSQFDAELQGLSTQPVQVPIEPVMPDPIDIPNVPPVEVPVIWDTSDLEIFMNTGAERFTQEIASANQMLERLNDTQRQINDMASQTDLMPDNAISDINNVQSRLEALQRRIRDISNNQVDFVSDNNSRELEQLRSQLSNAVREQERLNRAVHNMDVSEANRAYNDLTRTISDAERQIRDAVRAQEQLNDSIEDCQSLADGLFSKILRWGTGIGAAIIGIEGIKKGMELTDTLANNQARLSLIVDEPKIPDVTTSIGADASAVDTVNAKLQATEALQDKIYESAQRSRASYMDMVDVVAKLGLLAGDAFTSNNELLAFTEILQKSFKVAGTEPQQMSAALLQLSQAMAAGKLQGDEFMSVMENAPMLASAIADFCNVSKGELKEMSSDGVITADIIKGAVFNMAEDVESKFKEIPMTFADAWTIISNTAIKKSEEIMQSVNQVLNSEMGQAMIQNIINAVCILIDILSVVVEAVVSIASIIVDNWSIIEPIIWGIVAALVAYNATMGIGWLITLKQVIASISHATVTMAQWVAVQLLMIAQHGLNAAFLACPITWIIMGIIALIAIFYAAIGAVNKFAGTTTSATGLIVGVITTAVAWIINLFFSILNVVISVFGGIHNFLCDFANFFANVFNDPVAAVKSLFWSLLDFVLGIAESIAKVLQTIADPINGVLGLVGLPQIDLGVTAIQNLRSTVQGKKQAVDSAAGFENPYDKYKVDTSGISMVDYGEAWNLGYNFGQGIDNSIGSMFDFSSDVGWNPETPDYSGFADGLGGLGDGLGDIGKNLGDIGKDTKKMADKMELGDEDLKYLRDLAEQEVIDRTVFRDIKIDLGGVTNYVESRMDLDGITDYIGQSLEEAMIMSAEGVH